MAKTKRRAETDEAEPSNVHPSRTKRVKYAENDAQLSKIYNDLADEVLEVRLRAVSDLLKNLSSNLPDQPDRLEAAETRLIQGLCSGRKAARLGFSIALTEVFRLKFSAIYREPTQLSLTIEKIEGLTDPKGHVSGQEIREHLLGRRFAFQAILESGVDFSQVPIDACWERLMIAILDLASQKEWLRRECGSMIYEYLSGPKAANLPDSHLRSIMDHLVKIKQTQTPEAVGLWITVQQEGPNLTMPKNVWHHEDPLSSKNRDVLSKVMLQTTLENESPKQKSGSRQITPSFAWKVVFTQLFERNNGKAFVKFWENVVPMIFTASSSTERKALGLQLCSLAISIAPKNLLTSVLHSNLLRGISDQRASSERYLFEAAKMPLNQMIVRVKQEPEIIVPVLEKLLQAAPLNFDQLTKTKTVETMVGLADNDSMSGLAQSIRNMIISTRSRDSDNTETRVRMLADFLLMTVRVHKESVKLYGASAPESIWLEDILRTLLDGGYPGTVEFEGLPSDSRALCRSRLMSCLNCFMDSDLESATKAAIFVARGCTQKELPGLLKTEMRRAVDVAGICFDQVFTARTHEPSSDAFALLFALSILQVYNDEPDAAAALDDLTMCYQSTDKGGDSTTMIIELLLSFISKPSALFRKLAEQVFATFAADLTSDSLQSLFDILEQRESLSGQQELFDQHDGDLEGRGSESGEDGAIDVEDASDVEIVNSHEATDSRPEEDDDSEDASEGSTANGVGEDADEDEEAAFDKKLAEALGTKGMESDSDEDGSDMDDDQMMALEPHLTSIFKERQKNVNKKQEKKDAKGNMVNFKNRVLDLLMIFVKAQYSNALGLDLIHPLTRLVRTTTNKPTAEKAFAVLKQYFEACNKNKTLPVPSDHEACFNILSSLHDEIKLDGSKLHANACSRSSLFLSKVLVGMDRNHYKRIADMYAHLQSEWYLDPKSKVQGSMFTEWTSWSISTRKQD